MVEDDRRSYIRYDPDKNSILRVITESDEETDELIGLLRDVSKGGCAGAFHADYFNLDVGENLQVFTEDLENKEATIVWTKNLDGKFLKVGFEFEIEE